MDSFSIGQILKVLGEFGTVGLIIFLWWHDNKRNEKVLGQYKDDMAEQRKMYENNVTLTKQVIGIAEDLRDVVIMNTQAMTHVEDAIKQNQFCPLVRVDNKKVMQIVQMAKDNS